MRMQTAIPVAAPRKLRCHQFEKTQGRAGVADSIQRHSSTEPRGFDDLKVGEVYRSPSRTVTESHFAAFQVLSGDNHPIHYDIEFCRSHGLRGMLAHGFQVLCFSAVGAGSFPHMIGDKLIGFIEQSSKFLNGVYLGDTLYAELHDHGADSATHDRHCGDGVDHPQPEQRAGADRRAEDPAAQVAANLLRI